MSHTSGRRVVLLASVVAVGAVLGLVYYIAAPASGAAVRVVRLRAYLANPEAYQDWQLQAGTRCAEAVFLQPTTGYLGFGYGDSWRPGQQHQGLDIFGPTALGQTPVLAAYDGFLTRLPDWKSTVIIRIPRDPLQPARQIWTYYTHLAGADGASFIAPEFPPGTYEQPVTAGTLLGHQGNYSGNPSAPTGMHLHFSIGKDDGRGQFTNELRIENTYDPLPYLGLRAGDAPITCEVG